MVFSYQLSVVSKEAVDVVSVLLLINPFVVGKPFVVSRSCGIQNVRPYHKVLWFPNEV